ncbi:hypothetical protein JCM21900_006494 [Sporobolomyces salmonicolor]
MDPLEPFVSSLTFPRSTSASSLQSIAPSTAASADAGAAPKPSGFFFNSLSSVWWGLKAAAGVEVAGFLKAVHGGVSVDETANAGDKRARLANDGGQGNGSGKSRKEKRRRVHVQEDLLFDQVPPLMTPISQDRAVAAAYERSSSPVAYLSSSPEATRNHLRPYTSPSYADQLMYGDSTEPSSSSALPPSRHSVNQGGVRSLSGRRKLSVQGVPAAIDTATTTATANTAATSRHARSQSQAQGRDRTHAHHVHFSFPSSSSLPNFGVVANKTIATSNKEGKDNGKGKEKEQVGNILLGESGGKVSRVWKEAKEEEKRASDKRKIEQLEKEVKRLKGELSTRSPAPLPLPPRSPFKSRRSAPPPPPPPPPPPVGHPLSSFPRNAHPVLFTARASLKSTPPRPKRRASAIGGAEGGSVMDMEAFLDELGARRGKLRKVGLPKEKSVEDLRHGKGGAGEISEVLQRAFARKFARANGLSSPSFSHTAPLASSKSPSSLHPPDWSSPHTSLLSSSRSHPTNLSSLGRSVSPAPVPSQPVFHSVKQSSLQVLSTSAAMSRLPRSTSLNASIETTTAFGQALSTDDAIFITPSLSTHSRPLHHPAQQPTSVALSPSLSASSLPSAPPELTSISPLAPLDPPDSTSPKCSPPRRPADSPAASARLSAARRRSNDGQPLPGLELGTKRPVTPGRGKKRLSKGAAGESSPLVGSGSAAAGTPVEGVVRGSGPSRTDLGASTEGEEEGEGEPEDLIAVVGAATVSSSSAAPPPRKKGLGHRRTRSQAEKERRESSIFNGGSGSAGHLDAEVDIEEPACGVEELVASGTRAPDPGRVFGRA